MQVRTIVLVLGILCAAGVVGACSSSGQNSPPPSPLAIANPLDMSAGVRHPCQLVRPDQLAQFHLTSPGAVAGGGCTWSPNEAQLPGYWSGVSIGTGGIAGVYQRRSTTAVFQPTTISGYPAIHTAPTAADQRHGRCTVRIGVAKDTLVDVSVTVPPSQPLDYTDPCGDVDSFAAAVIANAEGKSP